MTNLISVNQIVTPTSKWQITIPKKIREKIGLKEKKPLNITEEKGKIIIVPIRTAIKEDVWTEERRNKLLKALDEIQGIWANDKTFEKRMKKREKIELEAVEKMRKAY